MFKNLMKVKTFEDIIFSSRWILYPINLFLISGLLFYVVRFFMEGIAAVFNGFHDMESLMLFMLGLVDAAMIANLILMIVIGGHQIFISKFNLGDGAETPQFLDHMDTGILKVKIALSISGITLIQILRDFFNLDKVGWDVVTHRVILHVITLLSALVMAIIWRLMHPSENKHE